jgi:hypothetical protein
MPFFGPFRGAADTDSAKCLRAAPPHPTPDRGGQIDGVPRSDRSTATRARPQGQSEAEWLVVGDGKQPDDSQRTGVPRHHGHRLGRPVKPTMRTAARVAFWCVIGLAMGAMVLLGGQAQADVLCMNSAHDFVTCPASSTPGTPAVTAEPTSTSVVSPPVIDPGATGHAITPVGQATTVKPQSVSKQTQSVAATHSSGIGMAPLIWIAVTTAALLALLAGRRVVVVRDRRPPAIMTRYEPAASLPLPTPLRRNRVPESPPPTLLPQRPLRRPAPGPVSEPNPRYLEYHLPAPTPAPPTIPEMSDPIRSLARPPAPDIAPLRAFDPRISRPVAPEPKSWAFEPRTAESPVADQPTAKSPVSEPWDFEPPTAEPWAFEPPAVELRAFEPPAVEPRAFEPPAIEPRAFEPPAVEPWDFEPPVREPHAPEPWILEPPAPEPRTLEPSTAEPWAFEPPFSEPWDFEPPVAEPWDFEPPVAEPWDFEPPVREPHAPEPWTLEPTTAETATPDTWIDEPLEPEAWELEPSAPDFVMPELHLAPAQVTELRVAATEASETRGHDSDELAAPFRLIQLLYRRRLVVVPMLLIAAVSLFVTQLVSPKVYEASGSILLFVPPAPPNTTPPAPKGVTVDSVPTGNPYLGLGDLNITVDIVSNLLNTSAEAHDLRAQGVHGAYSISPDNSAFHGPIVDILAKAPDAAEAMHSTRLVMTELTHQLAAIQTQQHTDPRYFVKVSTVTNPDGATATKPLSRWLVIVGVLDLAAILVAAFVTDRLAGHRPPTPESPTLTPRIGGRQRRHPVGSGV